MASYGLVSAAVAIISQLQSLDSESEDDDLLLECAMSAVEAEVNASSGEKSKSVEKVKGYVEYTVPRYRSKDFQEHFRLNRTTVDILISKLAPLLNSKQNSRGRCPLTVEKKILCSLYLLSNQAPFRLAADRFNVCRQTAWKILHEFSSALLDLNKSEGILSWPNQEKAFKTSDYYTKKFGFPGVIGVVDGKHMAIKAPRNDHSSYYNRKQFYSVILQAVCNEKLLFTDCYVGEAGSVHDACVYRRSTLSKRIDEGVGFPIDTHLLGDAAYPLNKYLLTPYRDNGHLTEIQSYFNTKLSKCRSSIERTFGLFVGRFRRFKLLDMHRLDLMVMLIMAGCILHNFSILEGDELNIEEERLVGVPVEIENVQARREAQNKRNDLANTLFARRIQH
ncbi:putative nuclease HARBI1 [Centruroides sculpturatus]|uniref:putative nuclease HARBI1 n=1 Tax=Centruroides sculpturatus TaxID=218467 RepID=UPI000C6CAE27|nr:putative nuclease HARBI1 [Centruroides sculpturatus]